ERPEDRWPKTKEIMQRYPQPRRMTEAQAEQFFDERRELDRQFEFAYATFDDYMEHVLYVLELVGSEHVGIGADWDGGGGVEGMIDVSYLPKITERLLAEGYSESDLGKIWSGNVLRLLRQAQAHAESLTE
ncbi:MAG: membrane dipeptidase, partial [Pseudomonadota bacterium]